MYIYICTSSFSYAHNLFDHRTKIGITPSSQKAKPSTKRTRQSPSEKS